MTKSLKYEEDLVDAITGILNARSKWRHVWGIPVFDNAKDISVGFAHGLVWQSKIQTEEEQPGGFGRRFKFPSWTWAGWKTWGSWTWYPYSGLSPSSDAELKGYLDGGIASFQLVAGIAQLPHGPVAAVVLKVLVEQQARHQLLGMSQRGQQAGGGQQGTAE